LPTRGKGGLVHDDAIYDGRMHLQDDRDHILWTVPVGHPSSPRQESVLA
jgi:hypothetical protein